MTAVMDLATDSLEVTSLAKVPTIRHKIRRFAAAVAGVDAASDVELMTAEAASNAIIHGHGGAVVTAAVVTVKPDDDSDEETKALRVEVRDDGPGFVVVDRVDHGRGLTIIAALAARWGLVTDEAGTCLFFEVDL